MRVSVFYLACYSREHLFFFITSQWQVLLSILGNKLLLFCQFPSPLTLIWSLFASPCLREKRSCSRVSNRWNESHAKASLCVLWGLPLGNFWPTCASFTELWNLFNLLTSWRVLTEHGWVKWGTWTDGEEPVVMLQLHFPHRNASKPGGIHTCNSPT